MDYADLYDTLLKANANLRGEGWTQQQRDNFTETIALVHERMANDGIDISALKRMAREERKARGY